VDKLGVDELVADVNIGQQLPVTVTQLRIKIRVTHLPSTS